MIVICEECGKKYNIDVSKIKGKAASFKCRACAHPIMVSKQEIPPPSPVARPEPDLTSTSEKIKNNSEVSESPPEKQKPPTRVTPIKLSRRSGRIGLRTKMLLLFLVIPLIFVATASLLYIRQLGNVADLLTQESTKIVNQMAEEEITGIADSAATQCKLYLTSHPDLLREDFNEDMGFKTLAMQKVGIKGYTALYELPGTDGIWRTWVHVNPKIIGIDMSTLRKPLGRNFSGFWKIYTGVKGGKKTQGYYTWQDKDGKFRDKFMACTPIAGTRFVIAATTYMDEFTGPVRLMQSGAKKLINKARLTTWAILGGTLLLIGLIVFVYSQRLTGAIKSLTEVTDRISVGELGMEVETKSKDEIGDLAEAIARMQDSIRLSIERLKRRR
jgi:HAMP domain-containing protein